MDYERITDAPVFDGRVRESHEYRYKLAARYAQPGDTIVDAACGTGYGKRFFPDAGKYIGVDREPLCGNVVADLNDWVPDFDFDMFISFETLEHVHNWVHILNIGRNAKRVMCISTPIVPTVGGNPFHVHDFTFEQITDKLNMPEWKIVHSEVQDEMYGIWVLNRI